jgi:hypothetical protein
MRLMLGRSFRANGRTVAVNIVTAHHDNKRGGCRPPEAILSGRDAACHPIDNIRLSFYITAWLYVHSRCASGVTRSSSASSSPMMHCSIAHTFHIFRLMSYCCGRGRGRGDLKWIFPAVRQLTVCVMVSTHHLLMSKSMMVS